MSLTSTESALIVLTEDLVLASWSRIATPLLCARFKYKSPPERAMRIVSSALIVSAIMSPVLELILALCAEILLNLMSPFWTFRLIFPAGLIEAVSSIVIPFCPAVYVS